LDEVKLCSKNSKHYGFAEDYLIATGTNYLLKASIRLTGSTWTSNLDGCQKNNILLTDSVIAPTVNCVNVPDSLSFLPLYLY